MCDLCSCSSDHIYDIIVTSICVKLVCVRVRVCARVHECARVCACGVSMHTVQMHAYT